MSAAGVLRLEGLTVAYGEHTVVLGAELELAGGRITALAGESGCGKSTTALAAIGYRAPGARVLQGSSWFGDQDLLALPEPDLRKIWGRRIAFLAQDAAAALNPALRVGSQLSEVVTHHLGLRGAALAERCNGLFASVGLPDPAGALRRYPHQFSGGQQQRIAIALALACEPEVLIMDEPTTGLDVTTQKQISLLLRRIVDDTGVAALYVSHDIALLGEISDELVVMYAGEVVESGPISSVLHDPRHPYTRALLRAVPTARARTLLAGIPGAPPPTVSAAACAFAPRCDVVLERCTAAHIELASLPDARFARCIHAAVPPVGALTAVADPLAVVAPAVAGASDDLPAPLLQVDGLVCRHGHVTAVDGVSFALGRGELVGIVGESGSGKSTLLRAVIGLHRPAAGSVRLDGGELAARAVERSREVRRQIALVFQNPRSALNPRQTVLELVGRPARLTMGLTAAEAQELTATLLDQVKLPHSVMPRRAGQLSGGQQQRVALARAFSTRPALLLLDEVTSALDVSVQATIIELIRELGALYGSAVLFVSHDLAVVRALCDRALVMKDGVICEQGPLEQLFTAATHGYTRSLVESVPELVSA